MKRKREGAGRPQRPGSGALSPEDAELWSRTVGGLQPLRRAKPRVTDGPAPSRSSARDAAAATIPVEPPDRPARPPQPTSEPRRASGGPPPFNAVPPPVVLERRKARRIASGRVEIESRIDLHGLRQAEAHRRLRAFLLAAQAKGLRTVLVITGKGGERSREPAMSSGEEVRGVIRRLVPLWLEEPELRRLVVSVTPARPRHGGAGALYVQLRKRAAG